MRMQRNQADVDDLATTSEELRDTAYSLGYKYIHNSDVRGAFLKEEDDFINNIEKEVGQYCLSYDAGIRMMKKEPEHLNRQKHELDMNKLQLYIIEEKEKEKIASLPSHSKEWGLLVGECKSMPVDLFASPLWDLPVQGLALH